MFCCAGVPQKVRTENSICGIGGEIRGLSHRKYMPEADFAGFPSHFYRSLHLGSRDLLQFHVKNDATTMAREGKN